MTLREQWKQEGVQHGIEIGIEKGIEEGIEKGIEKGALEKARETALNLSRMGLTDDKIVEATGLEKSVIAELKKVVSKTIQH